MANEGFIETRTFCSSHQVEFSLLENMQQFGLLEIREIDETSYFPVEQLPQVEKMIRLYADLGINMEGLDAIRYLLGRMETMQHEICRLKNILKEYELFTDRNMKI